MKNPTARTLLVAASLCIASGTLVAQLREPHIGYIYPAGGQRGQTFETLIGGQFLRGVTNVYISGKGVSAEIVRHVPALPNKDRNIIREKLKKTADMRKARQKEGKDPGGVDLEELPLDARDIDPETLSLKGMAKYRTMLVRPPPDERNAQLGEKVVLRVEMDQDAEPGQHELRLITPTGMSNPMVFDVNSLPEHMEVEPNDKTPGNTVLSLPVVVNGQVTKKDEDRFRFRAPKGLNLVIAVKARALVPYMADAVPGWFQATVSLYDKNGKELAYVDDYLFDPDPVLFYKIPEDGEYDLLIHDSIYRGREDFVYRIVLGELPFIATVFPLGGEAGRTTQLHVTGWNLPVDRITLDNRNREPGTYSVTVTRNGNTSAPRPVAAGTLPERIEKEPNNAARQAEAVTSDVTVNGYINAPGDWDVFRVMGKAGEKLVAEVHARRLRSPVDSILRVLDSKGNLLATNDDFVDKSQGLATHHADSYVIAEFPRDGACYVYLGDVQNNGGREYAYRLRLSKPHPDFILRAVPSSLTLRRNETRVITVHAMRRDGFDGDIRLELSGSEQGFKLSGAIIPADADRVRMTITAPPREFKKPVELTIEGAGKSDGKWVKREAVPADDVMQAFLWRHLVAAEELSVIVQPRWGPRPMELIEDKPVHFRAGGKTELRFRGLGKQTPEGFEFELSDPPAGFEIAEVSPVQGGFDIVVTTDPEKVEAGTKGNLIISAFRKWTPKKKKGDTRPKKPKRQSMGVAPAVPFEIEAPVSGSSWPSKKDQASSDARRAPSISRAVVDS